MKLKHIAIAVALVAAGAANAASFTSDTNNQYNNDMVLNIWTAAGSYALDLGTTFASFNSAAAAGTLQTFNLSSDSLFTSFITGKSTFSWNILGTNDLTTFDVISTATKLPTAANSPTDSILGNFTGNIDNYFGALNGAVVLGAPSNVTVGASGNSVVSLAGTDTYALNTASSSGGAASGQGLTSSNFAIAASQANNSLATGVSLVNLSADPANGGHSTVGTYGVKAYLSNVGGVYSLNVAAVPEPESLAMLLAGLGMIGSIALRRSRKA